MTQHLKHNNSIKCLIALLSFFTLACSQTHFAVDTNSAFSTGVLFEDNFKTAASEVNYVQPNLDENNTTVAFQIQDSNGLLLQNLSVNDFRLTENGVLVTDVTLNKNSITHVTTADIVFVVDVTGSMTSTIESAKAKLIDFVRNTRAQGYHTRMCLSTFGDYTIKKCTRFYNNDPKDISTDTEVNELISEITKLKALKGSSDPGGSDLDENPMRAVIDAAAAPWGSDSQRFLILVTDAGFLYSPGHSGAVGSGAPEFSAVTTAINQSKMKIFAVTPSLAGYDKKFGSAEGIVKQSEGEWYKYADLVSGVITLNTVLNNILSSIDTTFYVDYTLTSQSSLDPSKALADRNIVIELINSSLGVVKSLAITSNLPNGRVADPKRFVISDKVVNADQLEVYVNGALQTTGYTLISGKDIEFATAKAPNARIKIKYKYASVRDAITLKPINISVASNSIGMLDFTINGIAVESQYYEVVNIGPAISTIILSDEVFGVEDRFKILETQEMNVLIKLNIAH